MNILVTGANGQLGMELRERCKSSSHRFIFTDVSEVPGLDTVYLDITNREAVRIIARSENVGAIVNCAGYTDVERAEDDAAFADLLNHTAVENLAAVAEEQGATLIHISTDFIFPGTDSKPIPETAEPAPLSVYGATKLAGERSALNFSKRTIIIRTAWLYSPYGRNFVKTMLNLMASKRSLKVVADQVGTPTYAGDLADFILHIINTDSLGKTGIYNFTDEGVASWYDFAYAVMTLAGRKCAVEPCFTEDYPAKAARPHYSVLDKSLAKKTFGVGIPHWTESLAACVRILLK